MNVNFKLRDLLEAGMHLGHKTNKWNPNMGKYIYGSQDNIHIIDLRKTVELLSNALLFIENTVKNNGSILFIGTKSQASDISKPTPKQYPRLAAITGFSHRAGAAMLSASLETCSGDASRKPRIKPPEEKFGPCDRRTIMRTRLSRSKAWNTSRS